MLGLGSPHGDSLILFSAPLLNNLAVTFLLSLFFPFFSLAVSKEDNFSTPWNGGAELGWGVAWSPSLFAQSPFSAPGSEGEGARLRLQGVEPRGPKDPASWVTLLLWCLGPPGWQDPKV